MTPRYLFINENIAGHRTVHLNLAKVLSTRTDVEVDFLHVPSATGLRRLAAARVPPLARWDADLQPLRAQLLAAEWVRRRLKLVGDRYDALHFYTHNAALASTSIMDRLPSVVSSDSTNLLNAERVHGRESGPFTPMAAKAGKAVETPVYRHARRVAPSSHWVARQLISEYHVDPQRIVVNPMGIPIPSLPPASRGRQLLRIGFIGNPFERKGGGLLLREHARRWHSQADLLLITTSTLPRHDGVHVVNDLHPGDERLWGLLQSCDLFAFPSRIDQAPNAVLEAMAAGLPVVAYDVGAIAEMVVPGTGFAVRDGDERAFSERVEQLLQDEALRTSAGRAAHAHVQTVFSMERTASRLLDLLGEAVWEASR